MGHTCSHVSLITRCQVVVLDIQQHIVMAIVPGDFCVFVPISAWALIESRLSGLSLQARLGRRSTQSQGKSEEKSISEVSSHIARWLRLIINGIIYSRL